MSRSRKAVSLGAAALLALGSCRSSREAVSTDSSVRVEHRVEWRTDTVEVALPRESILATVPRDSVSLLHTSLARSEARINPDGTLSHTLRNNEGAMKAPVQVRVEYRDSILFRERRVETPLPAASRLKIALFWPLAILAAAGAAILALRR